jgi:hypothetical protein
MEKHVSHFVGVTGVPIFCYAIEAIEEHVHIRHQCWKTTVFSCHIYLIKTGVEKMDNI